MADVLRTSGHRVLAVTQPNGGQAAALNAGISRATGEIVLLLDGDDWCETNRIERVVRELERSTQALWVRHDMREVDACGAEVGRREVSIRPDEFCSVRTGTILASGWFIVRPGVSTLILDTLGSHSGRLSRCR